MYSPLFIPIYKYEIEIPKIYGDNSLTGSVACDVAEYQNRTIFINSIKHLMRNNACTVFLNTQD